MSGDDIVKRLRGWVCSDAWNRAVGEMRDAADAIEARDAQIQSLLAAFSAVVEDAITKEDEIERLRAALVAIQSEAHTFGDGCSDVYVQTLDLVWEMAHKALSKGGPS